MSHNRRTIRIAYFVSPHGYGHAARACAVMSAVQRLHGAVEFEIYTTVPRWFFEDSLSGRFRYHPLLTDIGFAQKTPLEIDLAETLSRLDLFYPPDRDWWKSLARKVPRRRCGLMVCDIAPLGSMWPVAGSRPFWSRTSPGTGSTKRMSARPPVGATSPIPQAALRGSPTTTCKPNPSAGRRWRIW